MNIELKHLQLIYNIEQLGNLSKSAEAMHITQPAASHMLKNLEVQLGVKIYHRVNKKMVLTKAGDILLNAARDILPKMNEYKVMFSNEILGKKSVIRIATECTTSYQWLPKVLKSFQQKYPGVEVEINLKATSNPKKYLMEGKIDLAIAIDPDNNSLFTSQELFRDEMVLVVSKAHKLSSKRYIDHKDLCDENYIMYSEKFENNSVAQRVMIPNNVRPKKSIKFQLTEAILEMVRAGMGATCISNWHLKSYIYKSELNSLRITQKGMFRRWSILTLKDKNVDYLNEFIRHFQMNVMP